MHMITEGAAVPREKILFIAFAIEDRGQRDLLKGQSLHPRSPFKFVDMSVKRAYDVEWKRKVRDRIKRSDGVLALISRNSLKSTGQKWEVHCAREEGKRIRGIWAYADDRTKLEGVRTYLWRDDNIAHFIDSLKTREL